MINTKNTNPNTIQGTPIIHPQTELNEAKTQSNLSTHSGITLPNTAIFKRDLQASIIMQRHIAQFFNRLFEIMNDKIPDFQKEQEKFQEWFGLTFEKYVKLIASSNTWDSLDSEDISHFLATLYNIEKTSLLILSLTDNDNAKNRTLRVLEDLEYFLRTSLKFIDAFPSSEPKVNSEILDNLKALLNAQKEIRLKKKLHALSKVCEKNKASNTISILPSNGFPEEQKNTLFYDTLIFIAETVINCSIHNHFKIISDTKLLLELDAKYLNSPKKNLLEQLKEIISEVISLYLQSKEKGNLALSLKLLTVFSIKLYNESLEKKYKTLINNFEYIISDLEDVAILKDISSIKNSLTNLEILTIQCDSNEKPLTKRNDRELTQILFKILSHNKVFENIQYLFIKGQHFGDLIIPSLPNLKTITIATVQGNLTIEQSPELTSISVLGNVTKTIFLKSQPNISKIIILNTSIDTSKLKKHAIVISPIMSQ